MTHLLAVTPDVAPETDRPRPDRLISGDPVFTTWSLEETDGLFCGLWESTPGKWRNDWASRWVALQCSSTIRSIPNRPMLCITAQTAKPRARSRSWPYELNPTMHGAASPAVSIATAIR